MRSGEISEREEIFLRKEKSSRLGRMYLELMLNKKESETIIGKIDVITEILRNRPYRERAAVYRSIKAKSFRAKRKGFEKLMGRYYEIAEEFYGHIVD